jgi:perosamine synthetase
MNWKKPLLTTNHMQISNKAIDGVTQYLQQAQSTETLQQISLLGTGAVASLEEKLEHHYGVKYALCVSNATVGLWAIAQALELSGTEFVTTPYTYGASIAGFLQLDCHPIFADIDPHTLTLDPDAIRQVITPRTKAILAVDIFGIPCDSIALRALADEYGIWYIADAAQSLGAYRSGLPASSLADALVVSFTFGKSVFAGEGGAILTDNIEIYQKLIWWTQHPMRQKRELSLNLDNEFAINCRIHPLSAVWADAIFIESLDAVNETRSKSFVLIDALNSIGLTEPINFQKQDIFPSFFRLSTAWKETGKNNDLIKSCIKHECFIRIEESSLRLVYSHPVIVEKSRFNENHSSCYNATNQAGKRIFLYFR